MPVSWPVGGTGWTGTSAQEQQPYHPSASWLSVTVLLLPTTGRLQRTALRPILDKTRDPFSHRAPLPYAWYVKECQRVRPWERGNPACSPAASRRKHACYVWSRRASTSCRTWEGMAAYAGNASRMAFSSASC